MTAAAATAELRPPHRDDFHPGLAQQCVGVCVSVVPDHDAWCERHDVVAVVPLLALCLPDIAARFDDAQGLQPQDLLDHVEEMPLVEMDLHPAFAVGASPIAADLIGD